MIRATLLSQNVYVYLQPLLCNAPRKAEAIKFGEIMQSKGLSQIVVKSMTENFIFITSSYRTVMIWQFK